jgi:fructose-specific phosphotransferase system component IIB
MIKYLLFFALAFTFLNASKILSYNIYDRTDRADVMITFDTPYDGIIKQSTSPSKIIIKLSKASIESSKFKKSSSQFLHSINIIPNSKQTKIIASVGANTKLVASKTSDSYGLRLRFINAATISKDTTKRISTQANNPLALLPTKKDGDMSTSYYIVVTILVIGILILFVIKKRLLIKNANNNPKNSTWLFQENQQPQATQPIQASTNSNQISIRFQKAINSENSVVMLDFAQQSYLVLMGKSNILLDKFTDNKPTTQEDFESILQNRHQELENFLNEDIKPDNTKDALQAYKERAASMIYES